VGHQLLAFEEDSTVKKIEAIIRPRKLVEAKDALHARGERVPVEDRETELAEGQPGAG
jgi:hypothetical protein